MTKLTSRELIWKHVKDIGTCMMVTSTADGGFRARPMRGEIDQKANAIWFFTDEESHKEDDVKHDPRACLTFADTHDQTYVSVSGSIALIHDRQQIEHHWNEGAELYYPDGKDNPGVSLLRFTPANGEYWDSPSSPIVIAIKFMQAKVSGERPELGTQGAAKLS